LERPLGDLGGVLLLDRPRRRVARVHERLLAGGEPRGAEALEVGARPEALAADGDGDRILEPERQAPGPAQVRGDVISDSPVAARRAQLVDAVLVDHLDADPVDLRLDHPGWIIAA